MPRHSGLFTPLAPLALIALIVLAGCSSDPWNDPTLGEPFVPVPERVRRVGHLFEDASPRVFTGHGGRSTVVDVDDKVHWKVHWALDDVVVAGATGDRRIDRAVVVTAAGDWVGSDGADVREFASTDGALAEVSSVDGRTRYVFARDTAGDAQRVTVTAVDPASGSTSAPRRAFRAGPGGLTISWNAHLGAFLAVYAWPIAGDGPSARLRVLARASRAPDGPWSAETRLFETPLYETPAHETRGDAAPESTARWVAVALEHAHLAKDAGRILFVTVDAGSRETQGTPAMWRVEFPAVR